MGTCWKRSGPDAGLAAWLDEPESAGPPRAEAELPGADELPEALLDLAVPRKCAWER